jgi:hypothetical protein
MLGVPRLASDCPVGALCQRSSFLRQLQRRTALYHLFDQRVKAIEALDKDSSQNKSDYRAITRIGDFAAAVTFDHTVCTYGNRSIAFRARKPPQPLAVGCLVNRRSWPQTQVPAQCRSVRAQYR